jgi:hypothetical protein
VFQTSASPYIGEGLIVRPWDLWRCGGYSFLVGSLGYVMTGSRSALSERRSGDDGTESDEDKKCFHERFPVSRLSACISSFDGSPRGDGSSVWLTTTIEMTSVHGLFFPSFAQKEAILPISNEAMVVAVRAKAGCGHGRSSTGARTGGRKPLYVVEMTFSRLFTSSPCGRLSLHQALTNTTRRSNA